MDDEWYYRKAKEYFAVKVVEGCPEELAFILVCAAQKDLYRRA